MLYNPAQMDKEELYGTFVAREKLLSELLETTKGNTGKKSIQHIILLGARGIGKTHMLRMVENKVADSTQLRRSWITVNIPEEQYGVFDLMDFFKHILEIIFNSSQLENVDRETYREELEKITPHKKKEALDKIVSILKDISKKENRQFLLLVDNIDRILTEKIADEKELEYFRSVLMTENFLMIIGTSTSVFEEIASYDKAFFRFFKTIHLQNLKDKEVEELLKKRAELDGAVDRIKLNENRTKIRAITDLTGGYPRLVLMLYEILEDKPLLDVLKTFNRLLDNLTPYYQHRMADLSPQQQKIIDQIMRSGGVTSSKRGVGSPTDIAKNIGWKPTIVTSQFKRLKDINILQVREGETKKRKIYYEISDQLFLIWYQMRYLGVLRQRIEYIVTFLKIWYDFEELKDKISRYSEQYQQYYSLGNYSKSYDYARSISIMTCAIDDMSENEKIHFSQFERYANIGKYEDALKEARELLKMHLDANNKNGIASDYGNIGLIYHLQSEWKEAIKYYEKAVKAYKKIRKRDDMAKVYIGLGIVHSIECDLPKSMEYYENALKTYTSTKNHDGRAKAYINIGNVHYTRGNMLKSMEYYENALKTYTSTKNHDGRANAYINIGNVHYTRGNMFKAMEYYEKAIKIHTDIENHDGIANAYTNIGNVHQKQGDLLRAKKYYEKALKIDESTDNKNGIAGVYGNIGNVYQIQSNLPQAREYYEKALKIYNDIGNREGIARTYVNIGNIGRDEGELSKPMEHYEKALKIGKEIGNLEGISTAYINIGNVHQTKGDLLKAREYYEKALKIDKSIGDKDGITDAYGNLGNIHLIQSNFPKAMEYYKKVLELQKSVGNRVSIANAYGNIGNIYQMQGELLKAIKYYNKSINIFEYLKTSSNYNSFMKEKMRSLLKLAIKNNKEKNAGEAIEYIRKTSGCLKDITDEDTTELIMSELVDLLADSQYDFAITILETLQKEHKDIVETCTPLMISAKYLKTKDSSIFEDKNSLVVDAVKKVLEAVEKEKNKLPHKSQN